MDAINVVEGVSKTCEHLDAAASQLRKEAEVLALEEARDTLIINLESAIMAAEEFQNSELKEALMNYFSDPARVQLVGGQIKLVVEDPETAGDQWIIAQQTANEIRGDMETPNTPAQRAAYWRYKVYPTETYEETIAERFHALGGRDIAPYWYFLEYGTGALAYPQNRGQYFLTKTRNAVEGVTLIDRYLGKVSNEFEQAAGDAIVRGSTTGNMEYAKWSVWYQGQNGVWYSHLYDSRTGRPIAGVKKRRREVM